MTGRPVSPKPFLFVRNCNWVRQNRGFHNVTPRPAPPRGPARARRGPQATRSGPERPGPPRARSTRPGTTAPTGCPDPLESPPSTASLRRVARPSAVAARGIARLARPTGASRSVPGGEAPPRAGYFCSAPEALPFLDWERRGAFCPPPLLADLNAHATAPRHLFGHARRTPLACRTRAEARLNRCALLSWIRYLRRGAGRGRAELKMGRASRGTSQACPRVPPRPSPAQSCLAHPARIPPASGPESRAPLHLFAFAPRGKRGGGGGAKNGPGIPWDLPGIPCATHPPPGTIMPRLFCLIPPASGPDSSAPCHETWIPTGHGAPPDMRALKPRLFPHLVPACTHMCPPLPPLQPQPNRPPSTPAPPLPRLASGRDSSPPLHLRLASPPPLLPPPPRSHVT